VKPSALLLSSPQLLAPSQPTPLLFKPPCLHLVTSTTLYALLGALHPPTSTLHRYTQQYLKKKKGERGLDMSRLNLFQTKNTPLTSE
jgi:hypothetical protein